MSPSATLLPDLRSPKSPRRFFIFSRDPLPPLPPLPPTFACSPPPTKVSHTPNSSYSSCLSTNSSSLGCGAQVVRRPSDARRTMKQPLTAGLVTSSLSREKLRSPGPTSAPVSRSRPSQPSMKYSPPIQGSPPVSNSLPTVQRHRRSILKVKTSIASTYSSSSPLCTPSHDDHQSDWDARSRRVTVRPPPKQNPPSPFAATLLLHSTCPSPTSSSHTLITLSFAYALDDPPTNIPVTIPWDALRHVGGHLVRFVEQHLGGNSVEEGKPGLTDGERAEESDLDSDHSLGALLRSICH